MSARYYGATFQTAVFLPSSRTGRDDQDYWVFGLSPSSDILKKQKNTTFWKLYLFPSSGEGAGDTYSVEPVRKS
jgi:hypothetical protein